MWWRSSAPWPSPHSSYRAAESWWRNGQCRYWSEHLSADGFHGRDFRQIRPRLLFSFLPPHLQVSEAQCWLHPFPFRRRSRRPIPKTAGLRRIVSSAWPAISLLPYTGLQPVSASLRYSSPALNRYPDSAAFPASRPETSPEALWFPLKGDSGR